MSDIPPPVRTDAERDADIDYIYDDALPRITDSIRDLWNHLNENPRFRWWLWIGIVVTGLLVGRLFWHWYAFSHNNFALWLPDKPHYGVHFYEKRHPDMLMNRVWIMAIATAFVFGALGFMLIRNHDDATQENDDNRVSLTDRARSGYSAGRARVEARRTAQAQQRERIARAREGRIPTFVRPSTASSSDEDS